MNPTTHNITYTSDIESASNFYLQPFVQQGGEEKYFHIVTDPEDVPTVSSPAGQEKNPPKEGTDHHEDVSTANPAPTGEDDTSNNIPASHHEDVSTSREENTAQNPPTKKRYEPKRYVTVKDQSLCADFVIKKHRRNTAFKLKNLVDDKTYPLSKSQWLPEASLGSQPYAICRRGQSFLHGMKCVCLDNKKGEKGKEGEKEKNEGVTYSSKNVEYDNRLFVLEHGRKT